MNRTEAYRLVLNDLRQVSMFRGIYDAKHGSQSFMGGVYTVMSYITCYAKDDEYLDEFVKNLSESEEKVDEIKN